MGRSLAGDVVADIIFDGVLPAAMATAPAGCSAASLMLMGATARAVETAAALQAILDMATNYAGIVWLSANRSVNSKQYSIIWRGWRVRLRLLWRRQGRQPTQIAAVDGDPSRFDDAVYLEVAAARIRSAEAATEGAAIAHQVFGAIGFTKDHILHRYTMRLLSWRDDFGNESQWALDLGQRIAARGADELWPFLSSR